MSERCNYTLKPSNSNHPEAAAHPGLCKAISKVSASAWKMTYLNGVIGTALTSSHCGLLAAMKYQWGVTGRLLVQICTIPSILETILETFQMWELT